MSALTGNAGNGVGGTGIGGTGIGGTGIGGTVVAGLDVQPLSAFTGAEIRGVDLAADLDDQTVAEIRAALLRWKVVFFRDQRLDHEGQLAFATRFGELTAAHPLFDAAEADQRIYPIDKGRFAKRYTGPQGDGPFVGWHSDVTAALNPPWASILRAEVIPSYGGDTQWTNLVAAYEELSEPLQTLADGLRGLHQFSAPKAASVTEDYQARLTRRPLLTEHPLVAVHPETGERALYVSPSFLKKIVGVSPRESEQLLGMFWEQITRPRYLVRFKWEPGSIAFWDNRSTCHLGPTDLDALESDRLLYRVTLVGDIPVGPDGRQSVAIEGEPFLAASA
jgi:alpha-ketoglutarate-dependent sulfate ester dioxygenase